MESQSASEPSGRSTGNGPTATAGIWVVSALALLIAGCIRPPPPGPAVDSSADYVAHLDHRGLVVDRWDSDTPAVLVPAGTAFRKSGPRFLLQQRGKTLAALWNDPPAHIDVRPSIDASAPIVGRIDATWKEGAIRLRLTRADGTVFSTGAFRRDDVRIAPAMLSASLITTNLDLRGAYRAELRNEQGLPVGWLRVVIEPPFTGASRSYDADIPTAVSGALTTAAIALVNTDIDLIESHTTDAYVGD